LNKLINIGVLGCANIARRSVIPAILELPDRYSLKGLASRSYEKASNYAKEFQTKYFIGYKSLIELPDLQAIYIPLPNALHAYWIESALNQGLHVLVEKSLSSEFNDVVRLNDLAKQKGLVLVENFQFRFHSQLTFIKTLLNSGSIGELRCIRSSFGFPGLPDDNDIRYQKILGGGALLDTGAYPIKIAQIFLGNDIEIKAASLNYTSGKEVDIWGGAYIKKKSGELFAEVAFGFDHYYQCSLELWGSKGRIFTNRIFTANVNHEPIVEIEKLGGKNIITLPTDNHFRNMMIHFHELINNRLDIKDEYLQNINQARLIQEVKIKHNG
jgi:predicted dehydrogenase